MVESRSFSLLPTFRDPAGSVEILPVQTRDRLITIIRYSREKVGRTTEGHIYARSFLTHEDPRGCCGE